MQSGINDNPKGNQFSHNYFSWNMRSAGSTQLRRSAIVDAISQNGEWSLICFQEHGQTESDENSWRKLLSCKHVYLNENDNPTRQGAGTGIAISDKMKPEIEWVEKVPGSRAIFIKGTFDGVKSLVLNVHLPNTEGEQIQFLEMIHEKMQQYDDKNYYWNVFGDFNFWRLDNDRVGGRLTHKKRSNSLLNNILEEFDLVDTFRSRHQGLAWTWRSGGIARRLDYIFTPKAWEPDIKEIKIVPTVISDHQMVRMKVETRSFINRGPGIFKINAMLLEEPEYIANIRECIAQQIDHSTNTTNSMKSSWEWIKYCIVQNTRKYAKDRAVRLRLRESQLKEELTVAIENFSNNVNDENTATLQAVESEMKELTMTKTKGAILRSRMQWLNSNEKNNKWFMRSEQRRAENRAIHCLTTDQGIVRGKQEVQAEIHRYYSELYKAGPQVDLKSPECREFLDSVQHKKIQGTDYEMLDAPITKREIKAALDKAPKGKTPGIDSIQYEVYLAFWPELEDVFMAAVNEIFVEGLMTTSQRKSLVTLIPKTQDGADQLNNYRGISLLCCDFKLISAVLSNRMKLVIGKLIDEEQTGFIKGRQISENICMVRDILAYTEQEDIEGYLALADIAKCFDCTSFEYTEATFEAFNFPPNFRRWMKILRTDTEKAIINLGWTTKPIPVGRSTPQGDPGSPQNFLLILETFAAAIKQDTTITGITVLPENIEFKNSHFCDDSTFILADKQSFKNLFQRLEIFGNYSGLRLNRNKTVARGIGALKGVSETIADITVKPQPIKLLGFWLSYDPDEEERLNFDNKMEKISATLSSWVSRGLSLKGKALVAKTLGISQIIYQIISGIVPDRIIKQLEQVLQRFTWNKGKTKIARQVIIQDIPKGGIKQPCIAAIVTSLKAKTLQRMMLNPNKKSYLFFSRELKKNGNVTAIINSNFTVERLQGEYSPFYKQVLKEYQKASPLCCLPKKEQVLLETIANNNWITQKEPGRGRKSFFEKGLLEYNLFANWYCWDSRSIKTYEEITNNMDNPISRVTYRKIKSSIPKRWMNIMRTINPPDEEPVVPKHIPFERIKTSQIEKQYREPTGVSFWARHIVGFDKGHFWEMVAQNRMFSSRTFNYNYRVYHNSTITRQKLYHYKIADSPFCLDCPTIQDSLHHASYGCPGTYNVINEIVQELRAREGTFIRLSELEICLGVKVTDNFTRLLATLLALTKRYITNLRYQRKEAVKPEKIAVLIFIQFHLNLEYQILSGSKKPAFYEIFHNFM